MGGERTGELYHEVLAIFKAEIASRRRSPNEIWNLFYEFCSDKGLDEASERNLRQYVSYWLRRKRENLEHFWQQRPKFFFEIHIASTAVTFGRGTRFPIHGIIDELDITNKRLIERTIRGSENDRDPPFLKDFQLWLLWKVIISIDRNVIPEVWRDENFEDYELIVETPYRDFHLAKNQPLFEEVAEDALLWINDLSRETRAIVDAWRNKGHFDMPYARARTCQLGNEIRECSMAFSACYRGSRRFPERREALRASFRPLYRALFNEQLWSHDLLLYQLTMMEQDPLLRDELWDLLMGRNIIPVGIESLGGGRFLLRVSESLKGALLENLQDEDLRFDMIFGSFSMGLRRKVLWDLNDPQSAPDEGRVVIRFREVEPMENMDAYLVRGLLLREDPWFLKRLIQRALFRLEKWGLDREDRARRHVPIQLIDTLFGPRTLRARRRMEDA
jgi:hypothetical protein